MGSRPPGEKRDGRSPEGRAHSGVHAALGLRSSASQQEIARAWLAAPTESAERRSASGGGRRRPAELTPAAARRGEIRFELGVEAWQAKRFADRIAEACRKRGFGFQITPRAQSPRTVVLAVKATGPMQDPDAFRAWLDAGPR